MKLPIKDIKTNPKNPRLIKDDKFKKLVQSLKDFPEMADVREIVVNKDHVVLGGNMRLKAMQEAGWTEAPVKVVDWTQEKQDEFVVKDNASFGEWDWDELANQYEAAELIEYGVDLPSMGNYGDVDRINRGDENDEWAKIEEFEQRDKVLQIVIQFETEADRQEYADTTDLKIRTKGTTTWSTWYPYRERNDYSDKKISE